MTVDTELADDPQRDSLVQGIFVTIILAAIVIVIGLALVLMTVPVGPATYPDAPAGPSSVTSP